MALNSQTSNLYNHFEAPLCYGAHQTHSIKTLTELQYIRIERTKDKGQIIMQQRLCMWLSA